jgi:tetraprenyl-beta-curcumene synthase
MATAPRETGRVGEVEHTELERALVDRRLTARAGIALVLANIRYWSTVTPAVRAQLHRWERHAHAIPDPTLRAIALQKLHQEHFNAEVAATLATLAPREHRQHTVEAIVAYEVMYDYLDGLTEQPAPDPLRNGHQLFQAFTGAMHPDAEPDQDYYRHNPTKKDGGYLGVLTQTVKNALAQMPCTTAITEAARAGSNRCAEAQIRVHAVPRLGLDQLERWATKEARSTVLPWREFLAGAVASVLAVHALIAAAANPNTTAAQATAIDTAYLSISALSTMLDSLIDYAHDAHTGAPWYLQHYENRALLAPQLAYVARHAATQARSLPNAAHHTMTMIGVVAYYTSAPTAADEQVRPLVVHIHRELKPLITPTLTVMRTWRLAKRLRIQRHRQQPSGDNRSA